MIVHPHGVVMIEAYNTDVEYELAAELVKTRKQFRRCENTFFIMAVAIVALLAYIIAYN